MQSLHLTADSMKDDKRASGILSTLALLPSNLVPGCLRCPSEQAVHGHSLLMSTLVPNPSAQDLVVL